MSKSARNSFYALPVIMARLAAASGETIAHRIWMMIQGTCTAAEYHRMTAEKAKAMELAVAALLSGQGQAAVLAPFVNRARANAKRLRRAKVSKIV